MKANYLISLAICSGLISGAAMADKHPLGVYLGADVTFGSKMELKQEGVKFKESSDTAFNLVAGYEHQLVDHVKLGLEAEYRMFGDAKFDSTTKLDGYGYFVNLKPKYLLDQGVYLAALVGIGRMTVEVKDDELGNSRRSKFGYQFGAELGYDINENISAVAGYRYAKTKIDSLKVSVPGFYVGGRYNF